MATFTENDLKECLRFNVELVKRFRIRISRKFDVLK